MIAGIVAMRDCEDNIAAQDQLYPYRGDVMCEGLARMDWPVGKPMAGIFVWVKIPQPWCRMGSVRFAVEMMERANVAVTPGAGFGDEGDGYLRLALVGNETRLNVHMVNRR